MNSAGLAGVTCLLFLVAGTARADDAFFPVDVALDASNPVTDRGFVGYANFDDYLASINRTSPVVTMLTGASIGSDMQLFNGSKLNMTAGTVGASFGSLLAYDQSTANMSGGIIGQHVTLQRYARFNFSGGSVFDDVTAVDNSVLHITGGSIGHSLLLNEQSRTFISGGTVFADIFVQDASILTMYGSDLTRTLTDPDFGGSYTQYTLAGHLVDGTDLTGRTVLVQNGSGASFFLSTGTAAVPEPQSWALMIAGFGIVGAASRRRAYRLAA